MTRITGLVKMAGVPPTESQDLGSGFQPQHMPPNLSRAGLVLQTAPASFRRFQLLLIDIYFLFIHILQVNLFFNFKS